MNNEIQEDKIENWKQFGDNKSVERGLNRFPYSEDEQNLYIEGYIQGRTDQYLEDRKEIERLKELIEKAYNKGFDDMYYWRGTNFKRFKTQNNIT